MKVIENRMKFYALSLAIIIIGLLFMGINAARGEGAFKKDIEFTGGSLVQVNLERPFTEDLRKEIEPIVKETTGNTNVQMTSAGETGVVITMPQTPAAKRSALFKAIKEKYNLKDEIPVSDEDFSASTSKDIVWGAVKAVIVGIVLILIYISFRFSDYKFGASAVAALAHDVLVMLAVYAVFRVPLNNSFIAAILTIVGYSINDTIIVFDRIRENKIKLGIKEHQMVEGSLVNNSINQTMSRSIATSLTTLIMVAVLFVFGMIRDIESITEFAFPIIIGVISGTYSSIFVASPLWYDLTRLKNSKNTKNNKTSNASKKKLKKKSSL